MEDNRKILRYNTKTGKPIYADPGETSETNPTNDTPGSEESALGNNNQNADASAENGTAERKPVRYDTKTGAPVYEENEQNASAPRFADIAQKNPVRYNPKTGAPIYEDSGRKGPYSKFAKKAGDAEKKGFNKKLIIIPAVVAAVIIVGIIVLNIPAVALGIALKNTAKDAEKLFGRYDEATGFSKNAQKLIFDKFSMEGDLTFEVDTEYDTYDAGTGFYFDSDADEKTTYLSAEFLADNISAADVEISTDEENVHISMPFYKDGDEIALITNEYEQAIDIGEEYLEYMKPTFDSVSSQIKIERGEDAKKKAFGKTQNCKCYTVTLPSETLEEILQATADFIDESDTLDELEILKFYEFTIKRLAGENINRRDILSIYGDTISTSGRKSRSDMTIDFYVANMRVVDIEINYPEFNLIMVDKIHGEEAKWEFSDMNVSVSLTGDKNPWENYKISADAAISPESSDYETNFELEINGTERDKDKKLNSEVGLSIIVNEYEIIDTELYRSYNTEKRTFDAGIDINTLDDYETDLQFSVDGEMYDDGGVFTIIPRNLSANGVEADISGEITIQSLQRPIEQLTGDIKDIDYGLAGFIFPSSTPPF